MKNPYKLVEQDGNFTFFTDLGLEYQIAFQSHNAFVELGYPTFEFSFYPVGEQRFPFDPRIKDTITFALRKFFDKNPDSVILYICDSFDNRAKERNVLFNRWFNEAKTMEIVRLNRKIFDTENDMVYYCSIIFNQKMIPVSSVEYFIEMEETLYNK